MLGRARVGLRDMVRMKLMNIDHKMIVRQKIALVQAGISNVSAQEMEAHFLSNGNVENVAELAPPTSCDTE